MYLFIYFISLYIFGITSFNYYLLRIKKKKKKTIASPEHHGVTSALLHPLSA